MKYMTIICDIKNSKIIPDRNAIQLQLIDMLKLSNDKFKSFIISPFIITLGDEWQGLVKVDSNINDILNFFKSHLPSNIDFYTGVGIGDVTVYNFELTVNQLDGPSFHLARKAIRYAKKNNCNISILIQ